VFAVRSNRQRGGLVFAVERLWFGGCVVDCVVIVCNVSLFAAARARPFGKVAAIEHARVVRIAGHVVVLIGGGEFCFVRRGFVEAGALDTAIGRGRTAICFRDRFALGTDRSGLATRDAINPSR
jgi:hypothetical protein